MATIPLGWESAVAEWRLEGLATERRRDAARKVLCEHGRNMVQDCADCGADVEVGDGRVQA